jgi:CRISPR-associated protein (TIGR03986 family)
MDAAANPIEIPPDDVAAYVSDRDARPTLKYPGNGPPQPCFYIEWQDTAGTRHVTFGHTPHFRLPYRTTPDVANPARRRKGEKNWDLAEAIFGRTPDRDETGEKGEKGDRRQGARGRVFFEDAFLDRSPANSVGPETHLLLSSPKLTTYQHYIVQPKTDEPSDILHWDGDYTGGSQPMVRVRGFKRYWHRKGAKPPSVDRPTDSTTTVRLARESCVFKARIRFENLLAHELGALLMAVELPADCRHQLGMAKAHGLGTFKITLSRVRLCDKRRRYSALFKPGHTEWQTGFMPPLDADRRQIPRDFFASWVLNRKATEEEFWRQERMVELAALLEWDEAPSQDWLRATRYLEIEHQVNGDKRNEYKFPGKVRALPSASQVRRMGPEIPKD